MKIEIKNVKHSELASQETHYFEATVYVDGKRSFTASNDGRGGCTDFYPLNDGSPKETRALVEKIEAHLKTLLPHVFGDNDQYSVVQNLECVVGDLVNDWLEMKDIKRVLKKISYIKNGGLYQVSQKGFKPTVENIAKVKKAPWWKSDNVCLNELSAEDALKAYRSIA